MFDGSFIVSEVYSEGMGANGFTYTIRQGRRMERAKGCLIVR